MLVKAILPLEYESNVQPILLLYDVTCILAVPISIEPNNSVNTGIWYCNAIAINATLRSAMPNSTVLIMNRNIL